MRSTIANPAGSAAMVNQRGRRALSSVAVVRAVQPAVDLENQRVLTGKASGIAKAVESSRESANVHAATLYQAVHPARR